ncbi:hypothetical protein KY366_06825 [Candidatus Woesearchaeota archaeon]|nr:hypothetical protein [Candidatus Woesearchaeota archaeon]
MVNITFIILWSLFFIFLIIYVTWDKISAFLFPEKRSKPKVRICPRCGNTKIKIPPAGMDIKMTFRNYCEKCGLVGNFPQINESKKEDFRKQLKKWEEKSKEPKKKLKEGK